MNDLIEFFNLAAPIFFLIAAIVWAEVTREFLIYILAIIVDGIVVVGLWAELEANLLTAFVAVAAMLVIRAYQSFDETNIRATEE